MIFEGLALAGLYMFSKKEEPLSVDDWTRYDPIFKAYAAKHGVDWRYLKAIALNESNLGREKSVLRGLQFPNDVQGSKSFDGLSWGIMQITLTTAKDFDSSTTEEKLNNPEYSIDLAARYLKWLERYFTFSDPRRLEWLVKSYNQGPGNSLKEKEGKITGYAEEYWNRWQRNFKRVTEE